MNQVEKAICKSCGRISYPRRLRCPSCGCRDFDLAGLEGEAKLLTFTHVHQLSLAYSERYITIGMVEFADGTRALGRLYVDDPQIGMRLKAEVGTIRIQDETEIKGLRLVQP